MCSLWTFSQKLSQARDKLEDRGFTSCSPSPAVSEARSPCQSASIPGPHLQWAGAPPEAACRDEETWPEWVARAGFLESVNWFSHRDLGADRRPHTHEQVGAGLHTEAPSLILPPLARISLTTQQERVLLRSTEEVKSTKFSSFSFSLGDPHYNFNWFTQEVIKETTTV